MPADSEDRRIARLGFDIHDGPLQRLALLAGDLARFRRQLAELIPDPEGQRIADGRMADLVAITSVVNKDIRDLIATPGACAATLPLPELFRRQVKRFQRETGVKVRLSIDRAARGQTPSQRIALSSILQGALENIREHSGADAVDVSLERREGCIVASVRDNGQGFDVARALRRRARDRQLGLTAMSGRTRLLGGRLEITSRRGGPTIVSAFLPAWEPPPEDAPGGSRAISKKPTPDAS